MESAIKNGDLSSVQVFLAEIDRSDVAEQLAKTDDMGMAPIFYAACGKSHVMVRTILDAMHEHLGSEKVMGVVSKQTFFSASGDKKRVGVSFHMSHNASKATEKICITKYMPIL